MSDRLPVPPGRPIPLRGESETFGRYWKRLDEGQRERFRYVMHTMGLKDRRWFYRRYVPCLGGPLEGVASVPEKEGDADDHRE